MSRCILILQVVSAVFVALGASEGAQAAEAKAQLIVAVAANAQPVMEELAKLYEQTTSASVTLSAGSTGMLARQVREGAPFDLFVSADMTTVQKLAAEGFITSASVSPYAKGRLVLWQEPRSQPRLTDMRDLMSTSTTHFRIAVANPETAPYGAAAVEAMKNAGVFSSVQERVVYSDNVAQALQFATSGNADCAFVPLSLVLKHQDNGLTINEILHEPIVQGLGVVSASKNKEAAESLRSFLLGGRAAEVLKAAGYELPEKPK